jgi:hypothetical protein
VSASGYSTPTILIRYRLGATPLSTLSEWTDVLHLSSKWGFSHLRDSSIQAIVPLACPVDKLVLARRYSFTDWIETAYVDLFEREEDLTVDEARRMTIEDVVAIAKGRREGRAAEVRPRSELVTLAQSVLSSNAAATAEANISRSHPSVPELVELPPQTVEMTIRQANALVQGDPCALISRWLDQIEGTENHDATRKCLVKFINEDHQRIPLMLNMILQRAWAICDADIQRHASSDAQGPYDCSKGNIGRWDDIIYLLHSQNRKLGLWHSVGTRDAALRLVHGWDSLLEVDATQDRTALLSSEIWKRLIRQAQFVACCTQSLPDRTSVIGGDVFSKLWTNLHVLFGNAAPQTQLSTAEIILRLLNKIGYCVSRADASWEMDAFYRTIETTLAKTKDAKLLAVLKVRGPSCSPPIVHGKSYPLSQCIIKNRREV